MEENSIVSIYAGTPDWLTACWRQAEKKEQFQVIGNFTPVNYLTFDEMRTTYRYELRFLPEKVIFTPLNPNR